MLCYATISSYAFWLYAFGPALALLRTELHFSYTMLGVYSVLWSGGAAVAGLVFAPVTRRLSRASLVWFSALGAVAGVGLFVVAHSVAGTLLGAFVAGLPAPRFSPSARRSCPTGTGRTGTARW